MYVKHPEAVQRLETLFKNNEVKEVIKKSEYIAYHLLNELPKFREPFVYILETDYENLVYITYAVEQEAHKRKYKIKDSTKWIGNMEALQFNIKPHIELEGSIGYEGEELESDSISGYLRLLLMTLAKYN